MKSLAAYLPTDSGKHWASGCDKCRYGMVSAPELTGVCELYLERLIQMLDGDLELCACRAGLMYRQMLRRRMSELLKEAKADPRMTMFVAAKTHPDIESAQRKVMAAREAHSEQVPTIHFEEVA